MIIIPFAILALTLLTNPGTRSSVPVSKKEGATYFKPSTQESFKDPVKSSPPEEDKEDDNE